MTAYLSRNHSAYLPSVVAFDTKKDWLLTKASGHPLATFSEVKLWETALTNVATLHREVNHADLKDLGCPFDDFETLVNRGEDFLRDKDVLTHWGMSDIQIKLLSHIIPHLQQVYKRVHGLGLQLCVVHGDAHPMNVLVYKQKLLWFDWREAHVGHPLLDAGWFLAWTFLPKSRVLELPRTPETARQLLTSYLNAFGLTHHDVDLNDVMLLALVSRSLRYHEKFFNWQSSIAEFRPGYVNYFLRLVLRLLEQRERV